MPKNQFVNRFAVRQNRSKTGFSGFHRIEEHSACVRSSDRFVVRLVCALGMVNRSTKERGKKGKQAAMTEEKTAVEETGEASATEKPTDNNASEETTVQAEVIEEEKAHGDDKTREEATEVEQKPSEEPARKQRGRPKRTDGGEPTAKKSKTGKKERPTPGRVSSRVANQKAGIKLQKTEELPERKRAPAKKAAKSAVDSGVTTTAQNGTAVEV